MKEIIDAVSNVTRRILTRIDEGAQVVQQAKVVLERNVGTRLVALLEELDGARVELSLLRR